MSTTTTTTKTTETKQVRAYACGVCAHAYAEKADADDCCRCGDCGGKFAKPTTYSSTCEGCSWGRSLRDARASVRRAEESLASAKDRLAGLLKHKPAKAAIANKGESVT